MPGKPHSANGMSKHDADLIHAKEQGKRVRFVLATDTYYTDDVGNVTGKIEYVDRYAVKVDTSGGEHRGSIWITKQAIVSTEVVV